MQSIVTNDDYFEWLCFIVRADPNGPFHNYRNLLKRMQQTPFIAIDPNDRNRGDDGKQLRYYYQSYRNEFVGYNDSSMPDHRFCNDFYQETIQQPGSVFEVLISISSSIDRNLLKYGVDRKFVWFWMMIESMGLASFVDFSWDVYEENNEVDNIIRNFMYRAIDYNQNLVSPLFPITAIGYYQHERSIYDQMNRWIYENENWLYDIDPDEFVKSFAWRE